MPKKSNPPAHLQGVGSPQTVQQAVIREHMGPLPAPEALADYEKALPGLAERIVVMAETEQRDRLDLMKIEAKNQRFATVWGRILAYLFGAMVCAVAFFAIHSNYPNAAGVILGLYVVAAFAVQIMNRPDK